MAVLAKNSLVSDRSMLIQSVAPAGREMEEE
jgi:hypothetical protein